MVIQNREMMDTNYEIIPFMRDAIAIERIEEVLGPMDLKESSICLLYFNNWRYEQCQ